MLRVLLVVPALSGAECEGDSCPARDSALMQALAVVHKAGPLQEESGSDLTQEFLAKVSQIQEDSHHDETNSERDEAEQEAELEDGHSGEEYLLCHATGKSSGQTCQHWPTLSHIPAGKFPGWNGTHYCQEKKESDASCRVKCKKAPASCEEGGANYEACRCEDLTAKTVAACEGKASGDKCSFTAESFMTQCPSNTLDDDKKAKTECKTDYKYKSMCHEHDGSQSCMPTRVSWCHTGYGKTLKWKTLGSPCIHSTAMQSGRRRYTYQLKTPTLSYCVPNQGSKTRPMLCTTGFNNKLSDETKAAMAASQLPGAMVEAASKMSETEVADILSFWGEA